jgi:hypothetical protein
MDVPQWDQPFVVSPAFHKDLATDGENPPGLVNRGGFDYLQARTSRPGVT